MDDNQVIVGTVVKLYIFGEEFINGQHFCIKVKDEIESGGVNKVRKFSCNDKSRKSCWMKTRSCTS